MICEEVGGTNGLIYNVSMFYVDKSITENCVLCEKMA